MPGATSPVQLRPPGAFAMTDGGMCSADMKSGDLLGYVVPATPAPEDGFPTLSRSVERPSLQARIGDAMLALALPPPAYTLRADGQAAKPVRPGDVVRGAKARIRDIRRELKRHAALQRELAELTRLVAAAKQKPTAPVRALRSAG